MEKVKITQEQADCIVDCLKYTNEEALLKTHRDGNRLPKALNDMEFDLLAMALYIGYEVEETPEDKVKSYYEVCSERIATTQDASEYKTFSGERDGIRNTLILLNIKIEGIN